MRTPLVSVQRIRSIRRKYSIFLLLFAFLCSTVLLSATGSSLQDPQTSTAPKLGQPETRKKSRKRKCDGCSQPTTQEIYIPLIDLPEARGGGELVFNSRSPEAVDVTPVFYRRNGTVVRGNPVRIESTEIRYVNIAELIPEPHRNEGNWGGLSLTYNGFNREMWSQFRFLGVNGGGNVDEFFTVKEESRADLLEAVWWMPRQSEAIIALGNITDTDTSATISFNDGRAQIVKLKPHETEIIRQNDRGKDAAESVRIEITGAAGSIVPTGIITARDGSFNSVIRFYNPKGARQPHLFANGLRIADVTAHMILRNTSAATVTVQPEFIPVSGRFTGNTLVLPEVNLRPNEVIEVDLSALRTMATNNRALETVSVQISNSGPAGSVIGSIYGINNRNGTSYDVPLRDSGPARSMTGSYPWRISDDFSTVVYVTNISDQESQFITQINYPGGNLVFEPRKVGPGETAVFDLKNIRDEGLKDLAGKQLPANAAQGQFKWAVRGMTNGKLVLIGRAEMISSSQRISTSYSCNDPCPPFYGGSIDPFPPPVVITGQAMTAIWETAYYDSGYVVGPYSTWATWTNLYDPVVTFEPNNGHSITITGVETGGTVLYGFIAMQQDYGWDGLNCYEYGYYEEYADTPAYVVTASIESDVISVRPSGTGGTTTATVKVVTTPALPNQNVQLTLSAGNNSGGHVSHSGTRPLGTLNATQGTTNSQGIFETTYNAPIFGGSVIVSSTLNGHPAENTLEILVVVEGLSELGASADYSLVGQLPAHPSNHWGNATAITNLPLIASDYLAQFPGADILRYNDMSLVLGGKFELSSNWSATASHDEHRTGLNCDVFSGNVPSSRWPVLTDIFRARQSPNFGDETSSASHWHLRFNP